MKILFITDLYPVTENEKTTPKTLLNFVKEWQNAGYEVDVVKPNFILNSFLRGKPFYKSGQYGNVLNLNFWTPFWDVTHTPNPSPLKGEGNLKQKSAKVSTCVAPLKGEGYDFIIAHMPSGILFADKLGLPFVAGVHNSDLEVLTNPLYKFHFKKRLKTALDNAKAIACRSYVIKKKLLKLYPEFENKTFVAPSGIDEKLIKSSLNREDLGGLQHKYPSRPSLIREGAIKVLTCANFKKRKNIDKVIEACKGNYRLTVIGDGKLRKKLEKLDKNAVFTGWLEPQKVFELMRQADVFVLPSTGETFGMVYLEAMAQGCITVCKKNDGIDGIIKDGENGFLIDPTVDGVKEVLDRINSMNIDDRKLLIHNAFDTVSNLTSKQCAENYLQQIFKFL